MDEITKELIAKFLPLAKGARQIDLLKDLLSDWAIGNPSQHLKGRASQYKMSYSRSFSAFLERLRLAGIDVVRTPGKYGGEFSATYRIGNLESLRDDIRIKVICETLAD